MLVGTSDGESFGECDGIIGGRIKRTGNHGTLANNSSQAESS